MRVRLTPAVAGGGHAHQAGIQLVLHIALEHAVFDQGGALGRRAFVIDAKGAAALEQGAVIDDGAQAGGHLLAHPAAVGRAALTIEVAFQAMADRFVQQHPGPASAHHHRHTAGRRGNRFEIDQGLAQRLAGIAHGPVFIEKVAIVGTPTAAMAAALTAAVLLDDHADVETHQRAHIGGQAAIGGSHQDAFPDAGQTDSHLLDPRIEGAGGDVHALEQLNFFRPTEHIQRVVLCVQGTDLRAGEHLHTPFLTGPRNRTGGARCLAQCLSSDGVAVGKTGFLAGLRAYAHALIEVEAAFLDDAVFQHPGFRHLTMEVQIGGIDTRPRQLAQHRRQTLDRQATRAQQVLTYR